MSRNGQSVKFDTLARDYPRGHHIELHTHDVDQLIFAKSGVMQVWAEGGIWVVPPARALWMPEKVAHTIHCTTAVAMRTIYLRTCATGPQRPNCAVLTVTPLMRELIVRLVEGPASPEHSKRLVHLLLDELRTVSVAPLHLPTPRHPALRAIADALSNDPTDRRGLDEWAKSAGMSRRTLARRFVAETELTFGAWRRQLRLLAALEQLAAGAPVTRAAFAAGYDSVSAFIHAFRATLGVTPGRYFENGK